MRTSLIVALLWPVASAQTLIDSTKVVTLLGDFQPGASGHQLECSVEPIRPTLGFNFRFASGYIFQIPLSKYSGSDHTVKVITRIQPQDSRASPTFLADTLRLSSIPTTSFTGEFRGGFYLGQGHYHLSWILLDDSGRACLKEADVDAELPRGMNLTLEMPPNSVSGLSLRTAAGAGRHPDPVAPLRLTVLLDAAPLSAGGVTESEFGAADQVFLLGALSALLGHLPSSSVRLVVFNLEQQRQLFRRDGFALESLGQLTHVLNQLQLARVDYRVLQSAKGHLDMLANLINQELQDPRPADAVIFLGPRERFHDKLPSSLLAKARGLTPKFFFLAHGIASALSSPKAAGNTPESGRRGAGVDYTDGQVRIVPPADLTSGPRNSSGYESAPVSLFPDSPAGLSDTVSAAVRKLKGKTFDITSPVDFAKAIQQIERLTTR